MSSEVFNISGVRVLWAAEKFVVHYSIASNTLRPAESELKVVSIFGIIAP